MHHKPVSIAPDILVALVGGVIAAVTIIPFSAFAVIFCVVAVISATRTRLRDGQFHLAALGSIAPTLVFVGLVTGAATYKPTKVVEQQLDRVVTLPSTRMTLAELSYLASYDRRGFPIRMSFCFADADKDLAVEWPSRELTVRDFLNAIESQTVLRRRFMHCGNGYTVLGGGDCSFGLYVRDPELAVPPFPRDRFDLHAYAARRDAT